MFFNALYCFGYLPKSIQLITLIFFSVITIRTLTHINGYEADSCILIVLFYFLRRLTEWIVSFRIHDWTIPFLVIALLALLIFSVKKLKFLGIILFLILSRFIFIWNGQLSIIYNSILTVASIILLKSILKLSMHKLLLYIVLGFIISFYFGIVIGIESIILMELFLICITQNKLKGFGKFLFLIVSIFTSVYLVELAFAHASLLLLFMVIILLLKKVIS